ncbi:MAG: ABC transporter permease [Candidatus Omnitrophota bacterium]|nr:ABC transporter permease [Candidatus Omnitrophota bacterium]
MRTELFLARRYLFRGKAKHISFIGVISCTGVALGVAALIVVISVMNGFDRDLMEKLLRFNYHLVVESVKSEELGGIKEKVLAYEGVESASVYLQTQVFAKFENYVAPLMVKGVDLADAQEAAIFYKYVKEDLKNDGFFVGEGLKKRYYLARKLEWYPLARKMELQEGQIRGTFKVGIYDIDNNYLIMDLAKAKTLTPNYLLFLGIRIKDPFTAERIKQRIVADFPEGVFASTWMETNRILFSALKLEKIAMFVILSLIVLVASFNIFATLTVKTVEKTKDIGVLKSLGFTNNKILAMFSLQGLLLGVIGVAAGLILGLGLCWALAKYQFIKLPEEIYYVESLPVALNYRDIGLIALVGIALAFFSSLLPAIRASRLAPSEALRYE